MSIEEQYRAVKHTQDCPICKGDAMHYEIQGQIDRKIHKLFNKALGR